MRGRKSPPLKLILVAHNLFLSVISAGMVFLIGASLMSLWEQNPQWDFKTVRYAHHGYQLYHLIIIVCVCVCVLCEITQLVTSPNHYDQRGTLSFLYYVNHLLKYYEVI